MTKLPTSGRGEYNELGMYEMYEYTNIQEHGRIKCIIILRTYTVHSLHNGGLDE